MMAKDERQEKLIQSYGDLYTDVARIFRSLDPMQLIEMGAPDDEYDSEISTILPRFNEASSSSGMTRIVHEEFSHWFGRDLAGEMSEYEKLSEALWKLHQYREVEGGQ
jgi:hypothetical protein